MCGIAAIVSHQYVNQELFDALTVLQGDELSKHGN